MLVSLSYIFIKREPYRHFDEETIANKILTSVPLVGILAWVLDEKSRNGHLNVSGHILGWVFVVSILVISLKNWLSEVLCG